MGWRVVWRNRRGIIGEESEMGERTWVDVQQDPRGVAVVTIDNPAG
jgi:hypothetical protein